jgi:hypothetical protein
MPDLRGEQRRFRERRIVTAPSGGSFTDTSLAADALFLKTEKGHFVYGFTDAGITGCFKRL